MDETVNLGYVKIAVHAYVYLLWHSEVKDVVLYAQELIIKDNPVIEILLKNKEMHLKILGAELLAHFQKKQSDSVNFDRLEDLVSLVCQICSQTSSDTNPDAEQKKINLELRVACLRSLREHVALMHKLAVPLGEKDSYIDDIMACILDNLDSKEYLSFNIPENAPLQTSANRPNSPVGRLWTNLQPMQTFRNKRATHEASTSFDFRFSMRTGNIGDDFLSFEGPSPVAAQVLRELGNLTRDARSAERILTSLLVQLDKRHGWCGAEIVGTSFDVMHDAFARGHQQFLLFKILLRHAAQATYLQFPERISLIKRALEEGLSQDAQMAILVLSQCLDCLHRQLPKPRFDAENEFIPVATDFNLQAYSGKGLSAMGKNANQQVTTNEQDEKTLRSVILCGIVEIARKVESSMQLVDTLLGVLSKREQVTMDDDPVMQTGTNVSLFECVMAAAEALAVMPDEVGRLPIRKFDHTIYTLLAMISDLPPTQAVYVQGILRMILPVGPKNALLSEMQTTSVLSSIFVHLSNCGNTPYNFSELSALFYTLMSRSSTKSWIKSLQFVKTLWTEALDSSEESRFHDCNAAHALSVLFFANQCLVSLGVLLGSPALTDARLPLIEETLNPNLKPSRQFGGVLAYTTGGFTETVITQSSEVLEQLRDTFRDVDLADRILKATQDNEHVHQEFEDKIEEWVRDMFAPEDHISQYRQKIGLGRTATPQDDKQGKDAAEELSQRTNWMLTKSTSSRHSLSASVASASEIDMSRRASLQDELGDEIRPNAEKSRDDYLYELLMGSGDLHEESEKVQLPSFKMGDLPMSFMS